MNLKYYQKDRVTENLKFQVLGVGGPWRRNTHSETLAKWTYPKLHVKNQKK